MSHAKCSILVEFEYDVTVRPIDIGFNLDTRELAVGFVAIDIFCGNERARLGHFDFVAQPALGFRAVTGLSISEAWGVWSLGPKTALILSLDKPPLGALRIEISHVLPQGIVPLVPARFRVNRGEPLRAEFRGGLTALEIDRYRILSPMEIAAIAPRPDVLSAELMVPFIAPFYRNAEAAMAAIEEATRDGKLPALKPGSAVAVFVHSAGNIFMGELAELVAAGFAAAGYRVRLCNELDVFAADARALSGEETKVLVAPHEFFLLSMGGRVVPADWGKGAIMLNVEQLHTSWFQKGVSPLRNAALVLDINLQSASALALSGLPTAFLPLGYVDDFAPFAHQQKLPELPALQTLLRSIRDECPPPEAPLTERPLDIFLIGYLSPRRARILENIAKRLSRWRCHFVLTDLEGPQVKGRTAVLDTAATIGLAQRAKIVLNLHQSDEPYFEWHRIVLQGIWQRALVITEPVLAQLNFQAGTHFIEAPLDELADIIDWLLSTEQGMRTAERIRAQGYEHLTKNVRLSDSILKLFASKPATDESLHEFEQSDAEVF